MTRYRRNAGHDEQRRRREREAAALGAGDETRRLTDRLRSGELQPLHVGLLSALGYAPAQVLDPGPANRLAPEHADWDARLPQLLPSLLPDLHRQFLRVAGIGACLASERLLYLPLLAHYSRELRDLPVGLPVEALRVFASTVNTGEATETNGYVGVTQDVNRPVARLWDLRAVLSQHDGDLGWDEEIATSHVGAVAVLGRLMATTVEPYGFLFDLLGALEGAFLTVVQHLSEVEDSLWTSQPATAAIAAAQDAVAAARDSTPPRWWSIRREHSLDYWSNEDGWTHAGAGEPYTSEDKSYFRSLPIGGRWTPGRPVPAGAGVHALLRKACVDLLIPWLLTGPAL